MDDSCWANDGIFRTAYYFEGLCTCKSTPLLTVMDSTIYTHVPGQETCLMEQEYKSYIAMDTVVRLCSGIISRDVSLSD